MHAEDPCLTDDTVLDFVAGRLAEPARAHVERHLGSCLLCGRLVTVAAGFQNVGPANDHRDVHDALTDRGGTRPITGEESMGPTLLGTVLRETYRLERLVGRGGMGEVYEASHARLPGRFAVKVLHPHCVADPKAIVRFRREAEITSDLRHPNIVAIIDFDYTPGGSPYLVMEYLAGGELATIIMEEAPLAIDRVLRIVDQTASALAAVHRREIVHRDLKPQNVFLVQGEGADEEHVKLCDFGISKVRAASVALTGERVLLGTPQYMAPEQARGTGQVDARADQFALAAIVYEMLTGRLAFPGDRIEIVVYRITHEEPAPLGAPWGPAISAVITRALEKDPARRFDSVADFAAALHAAVASDRPTATAAASSQPTLRSLPQAEPAKAAVTATTIPPATLTGSRRRAVAGGLGALAVLAVGTAAVLLARPRSHPRVREAAAPAQAVKRQSAATPPSPAPPPPAAAAPVAPAAVAVPVKHASPARPPARRTLAPEETPRPAEADEKPAGRDTKRGSLIDRL